MEPATNPAHIESEDATVLKFGGHISRDDALRQALGDGGLADACAADQHGVVLSAANERLHHAGDFALASDDGVELAVLGKLGQINGEPVQRAVAAFGLWVGYAMPAAYLLECLIDGFLRNAVFGEQACGGVLRILRQSYQEMLCADVVVLQALGFRLGAIQQATYAWGLVYLVGWLARLGRLLQYGVKALAQLRDVGANLREYIGGNALLLFEQCHKHMFGVPLRVEITLYNLLGFVQDLSGCVCEFVRSQNHVIVLT